MRTALALLCLGGAAAAFSYEKPEEWYQDHPECDNNLQSPIDLSTAASESTGKSFLKMWIPRKPAAEMSMSSNGPTLVLDLKDRGVTLTGQGFWSQYTLHEMRYHAPAEHLLEGERLPLERQLVFYPSDLAQMQEHEKARHSVVVISELYRVDEQGTPDPMLAALDAAGLRNGGTGEGQAATGAGTSDQKLSNFKPAFGTFMEDEFFVYPGSLTTPPCWEAVTWHVSSRAHTVTNTQLSMITDRIDSLTGAHENGNPYPKEVQMHADGKKGNARPKQERNNRTVKKVKFYSLD
eukprot:TRINITY_DN8902_c0_g1_i1.p1 TRINITY_DN8902_c0_g1~~TRINITY_DN8902_c0_g1_i1.p1  ORF type:complete len:293 (+),score=126.77 TRINITY_DN8902_c0_g1_i1:70-948(+)